MDGTRGRGQWQTPDIRTRYTSSSSGSRWPLRGVVPAGARRLRRPVGGRAASRPCEGSQPSVRGAGLLVGRELIG